MVGIDARGRFPARDIKLRCAVSRETIFAQQDGIPVVHGLVNRKSLYNPASA
jgi:hypothetical protein